MKTDLLLKIAALICMLGACAGAQTPPSGHTADWNAGYVAGWRAATAPPTTQPTPKYVPSGTDLAPILSSAKAGATIELDPAGAYFVKGTTTVSADNVTLNVNGAWLGMAASPGASTNIAVSAAHFTFDGCKVTSGNVALLVKGAFCTISDSTFDGIVSNAVKTDVGGSDLSILRCRIGKTGSVGVYIDQDRSLIDSCLFEGSDREYDVRYEVDRNGVKPKGAILRNSKLVNRSAANKQVVGPRMIDDFTALNCIIDGDGIRFGQSPPAGFPPLKPGDCNANAIVKGCTFSNPKVSCPVTVFSGSQVTVDWCVFDPTCNILPSTTVSVGSVLKVQNSIQRVTQGQAPKNIVAASSQGQFSEINNQVIFVP